MKKLAKIFWIALMIGMIIYVSTDKIIFIGNFDFDIKTPSFKYKSNDTINVK